MMSIQVKTNERFIKCFINILQSLSAVIQSARISSYKKNVITAVTIVVNMVMNKSVCAKILFIFSIEISSTSNGQEISNSCSRFKIFATVFLEHRTLNAMFRLLNPKLDNLRVSRYLVIMVTSCIIDLHNNCA